MVYRDERGSVGFPTHLVARLSFGSKMPADFLHCLFRWVSATPVPRSSHVRVFVHISCCGSNKEAHVTQQLRE